MIPVKITVKKNEFVNVFVYESDFKKAQQTGTLAYWIYGIGHKKTKKFERIEGLPERNVGYKMNWLQIAKYSEQYGLWIGEGYADCKVAGIIAYQTARGYMEMYKRCKHLLKDGDEAFFEQLKCEYMMSCFGMFELDIIGLDERLSQLDPEYNATEATFQGEPISMHNYIKARYGEHAVKIIDACLAGPVEWRGRFEVIEKFTRNNYSAPNLIELVLNQFEEWGEEMNLERHIKKVIQSIESHTLTLSL